MFKNWEKGLSLNQFFARCLAEGFPDDKQAAIRELEKAYEVIRKPRDSK